MALYTPPFLVMNIVARAVIILALLGCLSACKRAAEDTTAVEQELTEAKTKFDNERRRVANLRQDIATLGSLGTRGQVRINQAAAERDAFSAELAKLTTEMMVYRDGYKSSIRNRAPGMALPDFVLPGRSFKNVVVKTVDDWELVFKHAEGVGRLPLGAAPPEVRVMFAYNPEIGPKPAPATPGTKELTTETEEDLSALAAAEATSRLDDDAFASSGGQSIAQAAGKFAADLGPSTSQAAETSTSSKGPSRVRRIKLPDGTSMEVLAYWGK